MIVGKVSIIIITSKNIMYKPVLFSLLIMVISLSTYINGALFTFVTRIFNWSEILVTNLNNVPCIINHFCAIYYQQSNCDSHLNKNSVVNKFAVWFKVLFKTSNIYFTMLPYLLLDQSSAMFNRKINFLFNTWFLTNLDVLIRQPYLKCATICGLCQPNIYLLLYISFRNIPL